MPVECTVGLMSENLLVYQKALDFADVIASHTERFSRGYYFLVDHRNRVALSVATSSFRVLTEAM
jgi:hypothetical protein